MKENSVKTRIIIGAVGAAIFLPVLIFSDKFIYPVFIALLCAIATFELLNCSHTLTDIPFAVISFAYAVICPILTRFADGINSIFVVTALYVLASVVYTVVSQQTEVMNRIYSTVFLLIYIIFAFSALITVRDGESGKILTYLLYLCAWLTDTFAYFSGMAFGKRKLIPKLSPKKTIEGSIGGCVMTLVVSMIIVIGIGLFSKNSPKYLALIILIFWASVVAQIGDLAMSQVKRYYKKKDFGTLLPGHGGILDRFDSVLAVSLLFCIFTLAFPTLKLF